MFDEAMLMLPFATRTDMHDAMRNSTGKNEPVHVILNTLRSEHDAPGARGQLKALWRKYASVKFEEDDEPVAGGGPRAPAGSLMSKATTPPATPPRWGRANLGCGIPAATRRFAINDTKQKPCADVQARPRNSPSEAAFRDQEIIIAHFDIIITCYNTIITAIITYCSSLLLPLLRIVTSLLHLLLPIITSLLPLILPHYYTLLRKNMIIIAYYDYCYYIIITYYYICYYIIITCYFCNNEPIITVIMGPLLPILVSNG